MDHEYEEFCRYIKNLTNIDLLSYKEKQMNRRLRTLYEKRGFQNYQEYGREISHNQELKQEFLERMTINVTEFFRNEARWKLLEEEVIKKDLFQRSKVRCWSAACSTGEEPYTLAMILQQYFPLERIEIVATDLDKVVLNKAQTGMYASLEGIPDSLQQKYFEKKGEKEYQVSEKLQKVITFKHHNMLHDRFEEQYDLIVCRNVMIYFTEKAQNELYQKFNHSLKEGGYLFIGNTEQIFYPEKINFEVRHPHIYQKMKKER